MTRREYVIESMGSLDKKYLRKILECTEEHYEYPCKITLESPTGSKQYYVEESNIRGHGFIIISWGPIIG